MYKCPECGGKAEVIWISKDKKTYAIKCVKGHRKRYKKGYSSWTSKIQHPIYLIAKGEMKKC